MTRLTRVCRAVGVGLAVTTATLAMTQVASAAPAPPTGPASLRPPAGNEMFLASHGKGVQIYTVQRQMADDLQVGLRRASGHSDHRQRADHHTTPPGRPGKPPTAAASPARRPPRTPSTTIRPADCQGHSAASAAGNNQRVVPASSDRQRRTFSGSTPRAGPSLPPPSARRKRPAR